jgi:hypothetical protein
VGRYQLRPGERRIAGSRQRDGRVKRVGDERQRSRVTGGRMIGKIGLTRKRLK